MPAQTGVGTHCNNHASAITKTAQGCVEKQRTIARGARAFHISSNGGSKYGQQNYTNDEIEKLLEIVADVEPIAGNMWAEMHSYYKC